MTSTYKTFALTGSLELLLAWGMYVASPIPSGAYFIAALGIFFWAAAIYLGLKSRGYLRITKREVKDL